MNGNESCYFVAGADSRLGIAANCSQSCDYFSESNQSRDFVVDNNESLEISTKIGKINYNSYDIAFQEFS